MFRLFADAGSWRNRVPPVVGMPADPVNSLSDEDAATLILGQEEPKKKPAAAKPKPKTAPLAPPEKQTKVCKRPATKSKKSEETEPANPQEEAEEEEEPAEEAPEPPKKRPAAAPATIKCYKYMYHKKGMWGLKVNKHEQCTAHNLAH